MLEPVASRSLLQVDTLKGKFYFYRSFFHRRCSILNVFLVLVNAGHTMLKSISRIFYRLSKKQTHIRISKRMENALGEFDCIFLFTRANRTVKSKCSMDNATDIKFFGVIFEWKIVLRQNDTHEITYGEIQLK